MFLGVFDIQDYSTGRNLLPDLYIQIERTRQKAENSLCLGSFHNDIAQHYV